MNYTIQPWNVAGMSKNGPYIKVRGTTLGSKWAVANIPFIAEKDKFYGVEEAKEYAEMIKFTPTMIGLMKEIVKNYKGFDIYHEARYY